MSTIELYEKMRSSIVCIYTRASNHLCGGGVFIEVGTRQLVLTAAHVVHKKKGLRVVSFDNNTYIAELVHCDINSDVALLYIPHAPNGGFECAQLCRTSDELVRTAQVHFIGHPGRQIFAYSVGQISCVEKTCRDIFDYIGPDLRSFTKHCFIDDFRELDGSVSLVQARNVHGGGRFGGTGAPFLDVNGNIVGLYSFTFQDEDHAIHVAEVEASIERFLSQGKGKGVGASIEPQGQEQEQEQEQN